MKDIDQSNSSIHIIEYFTYLLTTWSIFLLEKICSFQEIPRIYGTRKFLTVPTSARHPSLISLSQRNFGGGMGRGVMHTIDIIVVTARKICQKKFLH